MYTRLVQNKYFTLICLSFLSTAEVFYFNIITLLHTIEKNDAVLLQTYYSFIGLRIYTLRSNRVLSVVTGTLF